VMLGRALAADPEARYPSAAAFADDVRRFLADEPIAARPPSVRHQLLRFARKNRALVATALALVIALAAGAVASTLLYLSAERSRRALAGRNQELLFARARAELDVDPTAAVATLATLPHDTPGVADLTRLAVDRGVARAVLVGHASEVRTVAFGPE